MMFPQNLKSPDMPEWLQEIADEIAKDKIYAGNAEVEETVLRYMEESTESMDVDPRWFDMAQAQLQTAFMLLNRAVANPQRQALRKDFE